MDTSGARTNPADRAGLQEQPRFLGTDLLTQRRQSANVDPYARKGPQLMRPYQNTQLQRSVTIDPSINQEHVYQQFMAGVIAGANEDEKNYQAWRRVIDPKTPALSLSKADHAWRRKVHYDQQLARRPYPGPAWRDMTRPMIMSPVSTEAAPPQCAGMIGKVLFECLMVVGPWRGSQVVSAGGWAACNKTLTHW